MKKFSLVAGIFIGAIFFSASIASAVSTLATQQGGTGTTTPTGILYGDGTLGLTSIHTTTIGTGLTFSGGTLSATGGIPGGLNLQVQYNNAGSFGGISGAVTDGTILNLTNPLLGGATLTTSIVNGVTLTTAGSASTFLNGTGAYSVPATGLITDPNWLMDTFGNLTPTTTVPVYLPTTTGIGTSSPFALLSVQANNGTTNQTLFAIGSSTATATSTLFSVNNQGGTIINNFAGSGTALTVNQVGANGTAIGLSGFGNGTGVNCTPGNNGTCFMANMTAAVAVTENAIAVTGTANMTADYTGAFVLVTPTRNVLSAATRNHSGNIVDIAPVYSTSAAQPSILNVSGTTTVLKRTLSNASTGASAAINVTAPVVEISNNETATRNVTDTSNVLAVLQNATTSSGTVFQVNNAGTGSLATFNGNGNFGIGSTTPGTLFSVGTVNGINFTTATSTFNSTGGINLTAGCYAISGVCLTSGTGTVTSVSTNATLTGGPITTTGTLGLNLTNPNSWSGLQQFANATSTLFSTTYGSTTNAFFGNATIANLGIPAGQFAAFDPTGKLIGTSTPSGSNSAFSPAANYATAAGLVAYTSSAGVITEVGTGALSVDGNSPTIGQIILVKNESGSCTSSSGACNNGLYNVTAAGSGIAAFVLTRNSNYNSSSNVIPGIITYVISGATLADDFWAMTSAAPITVGTTALNYTEVSGGGSSVTSVAQTVPSFLSISGSPITTSGTLAIGYSGIALPVANGGTATTTGNTNGLTYFDGTRLTEDPLKAFFDGISLGIGTSSPYKKLSVGGDVVIGASTAGGTLGNLYIPTLATPAGTFVAADPTGKLIATTSPSGGGSGIVQVTATFTSPTTAYGVQSATASCSGSQKVSGGGFTGLPNLSASSPVTEMIQQDYPSSATAWTVQMQCQNSGNCSGQGGGQTITVYAICVNP